MSNQALVSRYLAAKKALFDQKYAFLNEKQREAVFTTQGPLLVLAGAGTGKTTLLVNRIAYILKYGNAYFSENIPVGVSEESIAEMENAKSANAQDLDLYLESFADRSQPIAPWNILAITFTNKAAGEIRSRINNQLGDGQFASEIWSGTFHSVCLRILRSHGEKIGYASGFSIYDTDDNRVTGRVRIMQRKTRGTTRRNQDGFPDTCTNTVDRNQIFAGQLTVFHNFHFHKLRPDQRILLSRGNDISSDNTS